MGGCVVYYVHADHSNYNMSLSLLQIPVTIMKIEYILLTLVQNQYTGLAMQD